MYCTFFTMNTDATFVKSVCTQSLLTHYKCITNVNFIVSLYGMNQRGYEF